MLEQHRDGPLLRLTLNRPERGNALDSGLVTTLAAAIELALASDARLLIIDGAGANFCSGFDLGAVETETPGDIALRFIRIELLLQTIYHSPILTCALAHGRVFGAGADLFCACHWRIAAPETRFSMPGLRFGIVLGTRRLAHRIGQVAAQRLLSEARVIDSQEALALGFATEVVSREGWHSVLDRASRAATTLPSDGAASLYQVTTPDCRDADLAELARTASQPELRERILEYRRGLQEGRSKPI